jgi:hypothetical protein
MPTSRIKKTRSKELALRGLSDCHNKRMVKCGEERGWFKLQISSIESLVTPPDMTSTLENCTPILAERGQVEETVSTCPDFHACHEQVRGSQRRVVPFLIYRVKNAYT